MQANDLNEFSLSCKLKPPGACLVWLFVPTAFSINYSACWSVWRWKTFTRRLASVNGFYTFSTQFAYALKWTAGDFLKQMRFNLLI